MDSLLSTRAAILLTLRRGPACGLDIVERLGQATGETVVPSEGALYPALRELERGKFVRRMGPRPGKGRGRSPIDYELTLAGVRESDGVRSALQKLVASGREERPPLDQRMHVRVLESAALSHFAALLRSNLLRSRRA